MEPTGKNGGTHGKSGDCEVGRARAGGGGRGRGRAACGGGVAARGGGGGTRVAGLRGWRRGGGGDDARCRLAQHEEMYM